MELFDNIFHATITATVGIVGYFIRELYSKVKDIKSDSEILDLVNSRYVSRREQDLVLQQRDEYRATTKAEFERIWSEIDRLRDRP